MQLKVLGCHGGETQTHRATSYLLNDRILIDAGSVSRGLSIAQQCAVDHVLITHSHLDHIRDLALLADNIIGEKKSTLKIYCTEPTAAALETHIFNNVIWPDFTKIPNPAIEGGGPTISIQRIEPGVPIIIDGIRIQSVPVNHPVDCQAFIFESDRGAFAYSGDTGPTEMLWQKLAHIENLRFIILEVSFPNAMRALADISGHLTPEMVGDELKKLDGHGETQILLYHLKPGYEDVLAAEIDALDDDRLHILRPMELFVV